MPIDLSDFQVPNDATNCWMCGDSIDQEHPWVEVREKGKDSDPKNVKVFCTTQCMITEAVLIALHTGVLSDIIAMAGETTLVHPHTGSN